mgnify:CR=1 FL=1|jgi:hypothetical protein
MIALGSLAAFEELQAMIKGKIGDFLNAERKLQVLMNSASVSIKSKATGLMAAQKSLEADLSIAQGNVEKFQSGAWSFGDIITTGEIGNRLLQHISQVNQLEKEANNMTVIKDSSPTNYAPYVVVAVAALFLLKLR